MPQRKSPRSYKTYDESQQITDLGEVVPLITSGSLCICNSSYRRYEIHQQLRFLSGNLEDNKSSPSISFNFSFCDSSFINIAGWKYKPTASFQRWIDNLLVINDSLELPQDWLKVTALIPGSDSLLVTDGGLLIFTIKLPADVALNWSIPQWKKKPF